MHRSSKQNRGGEKNLNLFQTVFQTNKIEQCEFRAKCPTKTFNFFLRGLGWYSEPVSALSQKDKQELRKAFTTYCKPSQEVQRTSQ